MTEVPEHLLRRSRERRKALGLPVPGEEGDEEAAPAAEAPAAGEEPAEAPAAAAADAPAAAEGEDTAAAAAASGVPAHLLERSKRRRAALAGDGPRPRSRPPPGSAAPEWR